MVIVFSVLDVDNEEEVDELSGMEITFEQTRQICSRLPHIQIHELMDQTDAPIQRQKTICKLAKNRHIL